MPEEPQRPSQAVQIASLIINCVQTIALTWMGAQLHRTDDKVVRGLEVQQEVKQETADRATEIKTAVDTRANRLDKEAADQKKATAAILYGNWKYLVENAVTPDDIKAAADAKKRYDEFASKK